MVPAFVPILAGRAAGGSVVGTEMIIECGMRVCLGGHLSAGQGVMQGSMGAETCVSLSSIDGDLYSDRT